MSLTYSDTKRFSLPNWAHVEWKYDSYRYEGDVYFQVRCNDGVVGIKVTMPEQFAQPSIKRRRIIEDMIEQLTVQLATLTLEEK